MNVFFLMALMFISYVGSKIFGKLCSNLVIGGSVASYALYFIFNGVVACIFFFISGGFKLSINLQTAIYSLVFALIVILSIVGLAAYKFADVTTITIITSTCGLIATSVLGALIFKENVAFSTVLRIIIMLLAGILSFWDKEKSTQKKKGTPHTKRKNFVILLAIIFLMLLSNSAATLTTKFYALDPDVTDENSFFFFTNVFLIIITFIAFIIDSIKNKDHFKAAIKLLNPKKSISLIGNTICSNINSLVGILLIALIDVSVYSPITSALGIISGVVASLIFRERLGICSYLAAIVACIAIII